ncbi:hypothetical protein ISN76_02735 [Dyella halodurans]|uniref:DUF6491 family protein n=1 Tax=Dyella halodurans TaxID=1920171 RepID=A0ABV9BX23_9GAMM|nr:DUF6491 family protein [Dyella halodurans]
MKIRKGKVWSLACVVWLIASGVAMAGAEKDLQAAERDAYVKAAGHAVQGIADTALVTSVDPLGDHRIAVYTVDGSHKNVWLVTTDEGCPQPMLSGNRIVSLDAGVSHDCRSVVIQTVDKRDLGNRLRVIESRPTRADATYPIDQETLRWETMFRTGDMTDGGRTR